MGTKWTNAISTKSLYNILEEAMQEIEERKNTSDKIKLMQYIAGSVCGDCGNPTCVCEVEPKECSHIKRAIKLHDQYLIKMCEEE